MLTSAELTAMRATLDDSLPDTAIIKTPIWTSDGRGGGTTTFVAAGTVDCRVSPVASSSEGERVQGGRVQPDTEYIFTFPYDTAIDSDSMIAMGSATYTVTSLRAPRSWELSRRVEAKEVK